MLKETLAAEAAEAAEEARLFNLEHPHQVVSSTPFQEKEFGDKPLQTIRASKDITPDLSAIVVSLALFDGDYAALCLYAFLTFMCTRCLLMI